MNFKTRYRARALTLDVLGWAFGLTTFIFVYAWIKQEKFYDFREFMYPRARARNLSEQLEAMQDYKERVVRPLYYWLILTVPFDIGIRRLLKKRSNMASN